MRHVPSWKQRIAGKSLPMEKFAIAKADRFLAQGNYLVLPALELIYVWNGFKVLGKSWQLMEPVFLLVENCLKDIEVEKGMLLLGILQFARDLNAGLRPQLLHCT